uniref:Uncharacterized protein n=1 Tax=Spironucleus salmonicida TaxID=348837 RepID=V6LQE7_9EUKA|eukprot:EST46810.1 Hypothetical protein SS50377_13174 [Spironucleus salmonicida]
MNLNENFAFLGTPSCWFLAPKSLVLSTDRTHHLLVQHIQNASFCCDFYSQRLANGAVQRQTFQAANAPNTNLTRTYWLRMRIARDANCKTL